MLHTLSFLALERDEKRFSFHNDSQNLSNIVITWYFYALIVKMVCIEIIANFWLINNRNWAAKQQTSWVITPWWFCVSPWRICITFVWPSGFQKLTAPSSRWERHLHFSSSRLCLALLFIILMCSKLGQLDWIFINCLALLCIPV